MSLAIQTSRRCLFLGGVGDGERRLVPDEHDQYRIAKPIQIGTNLTALQSMQRLDSYYRRASLVGVDGTKHSVFLVDDASNPCAIELLLKGYKCEDR